MKILRKEISKIMKHPMPWVLTVLFWAMNLLLLYDYVGRPQYREEFQRIHAVILEYGLNLNDTDPEFDDTDELAAFYSEYVEENRKLYDDLDMVSMLEQRLSLSHLHPTDAYHDFLTANYEKIQERVEEITATGEGAYGFYPGTVYQFHSLMYNRLGSRLLLEMTVLTALCVLYLMDYERMHKTRDMVIVTRTGKGVMVQKILAGIGAGLLHSFFLVVGSYGYFFYCVPFQGLWKVPVTAAILAEQRLQGLYPFITYWKLTVGSYFGLVLVVFFFFLLVVGILTAAIQLVLQNSYFTFLIETLLFMGWYLLCYWNIDSLLNVCKNLNLSALWVLCGSWFFEHEISLSFAGSEFWSLSLSAGAAFIVLLIGKFRYSRLEIK